MPSRGIHWVPLFVIHSDQTTSNASDTKHHRPFHGACLTLPVRVPVLPSPASSNLSRMASSLKSSAGPCPLNIDSLAAQTQASRPAHTDCSCGDITRGATRRMRLSWLSARSMPPLALGSSQMATAAQTSSPISQWDKLSASAWLSFCWCSHGLPFWSCVRCQSQ